MKLFATNVMDTVKICEDFFLILNCQAALLVNLCAL